MISTDKHLVRQLRKAFERHGFQDLMNPSSWSNLLLQRNDDRLAVTCLDGRSKIISQHFGLVERMRLMSLDVCRVNRAKVIFVVSFALTAAERQAIAALELLALYPAQVADTLEVLDPVATSAASASADQIMLACQMPGMCRRFAKSCDAGGDLAGALWWRRRQAALTPGSLEVQWVMADLQSRLGSLDDAELSARQVLRRDPQNLPVLLLLADIKQRQGDAAAAQELIRSAVAYFPGSVVARQRATALGC